MLKREHRLPPVIRFAHAKQLRLPYLTIKYQRSSLSLSRAGIVVSKRVSPKATTRNRLKRLLTTQLRQSLSHFSSSYDLLFILHPTITNMPEEELSKRFAEDLRKLSL